MASELATVRALYRKLLRAPRLVFPPARASLEAPNTHGVYVLRSPRGEVVHVGRTVRGRRGLRQRLTNHLQGNSSFTNHFLHRKGAKLRGSYTYAFVEVAHPRTRALLEAYAVGSLCPKHLGLGENATA